MSVAASSIRLKLPHQVAVNRKSFLVFLSCHSSPVQQVSLGCFPPSLTAPHGLPRILFSSISSILFDLLPVSAPLCRFWFGTNLLPFHQVKTTSSSTSVSALSLCSNAICSRQSQHSSRGLPEVHTANNYLIPLFLYHRESLYWPETNLVLRRVFI